MGCTHPVIYNTNGHLTCIQCGAILDPLEKEYGALPDAAEKPETAEAKPGRKGGKRAARGNEK